MANGTGSVDQVGKLLKTLELPKSSRESRMDIHLVLIREIANESSDFMEDLSRSAVLFLKHIKNDMKKDDSALVQSAINVLGYLLHSPDIVSSFSGSILKGILQDIFTLLQTTDDKAVCTRALWCLSKQNLPSDIIANEISRLLSLINLCILGKSFESGSVEIEAINVFQRLLVQCPDKMLTNKDDWFKMVYPFVISNTPKVAEKALKFLEQNVSELTAHSVNFSKCLMNDLSEGLTERLRVMFTKKQELFVLRVWSCFITILDKNMHQGSPLTNSLFKVIEQAFKANSLEILDAAYRAWMALIDNFATSKANILSQKRLKLLLMPLANSTSKSERKLQVEQARFNCWLHLIRILKDDLNEIFDQVVAPFLLFLFTMPETPETPVNLALPKTPTNARGTDGSKIGTPKTPATTQFDIALKGPGLPKNLHYGSDVLKKKGAEVLYQLITEEIDKDVAVEAKETCKFERLSVEKFKKHSVLMMVALQDLTCHCGKDLEESLLSGIWKSFCFYIKKVAAEGTKTDLTVSFGGLLLSLQTLVEINCTSSQVALKIISGCYDDLNTLINQHRDLLKTDTNTQGSFPIHIFQLMFNERFLKDQASLSSERFFKVFETLMVDMMSSVSGQLVSCNQVVKTIDTVAQHFKDKDTLWCFWNTSVDLLMEYINQNHDVNQGDALEHDFSAILEVLIFPVKNLLDSDLPMAVVKEIDASWTKLFFAFVRESALIATIDDNQAIEEFCSRLNTMLKRGEIHLKDLKFLGRLTPMISKVADKLQFPNVVPENRAKTTPKSISKKQKNLLNNSKSLIGVLYAVLKFVSDAETRKENKQAEQHLHSTLDVISNYFSIIEGADLIKESVETFSRSLVVLLKGEGQKSDSKSPGKSSGSTRQHQFIAKVLSSIYTCVLERYGNSVDAELLQIMTPLIKTTLTNEKSLLRNRTVEFWNKTFGQITFLTYPDDLREFLRKVKTNVPLLLPGLERPEGDPVATAETEEVAQLSENSALSQSPNIRKTIASTLIKSPHKIHGSFLQKARSAEKAIQSPPAKKVIAIASPKTEPKQKSVRRKLPILLEKETDEFVEIAPSPKKRRILTEHQKDVLRTKSDVPVLYNQLDANTQDAFLSDDTQCTMDSAQNKKATDSTDIQDIKGDESPRPSGTNGLVVQRKNSIAREETTKKKPEIVSEKAAEVNTKDDNNIARVSQPINKLEEKKAENNAKGKVKSTARKSVLTFKDLLSQVASMDTSIEEDSGSEPERVTLSSDSESEPTPVKSKSLLVDQGEVVPSSYTPLKGSSPERPLRFAFSASSNFAKAAESPPVKSTVPDKGIEKLDKNQGLSDSKEIPDSGKTDDDQSTIESNATSASPDFIPSSQSQKDPTPVLRGVTLLTPRRSTRQGKKTERVIEAVRSKALPLGRSAALDINKLRTGVEKEAAKGDTTKVDGKSRDLEGAVDKRDVAKEAEIVKGDTQKVVSSKKDNKESYSCIDDGPNSQPTADEVPKGDVVKSVIEQPLKRSERNRAKSLAVTKVLDTSQNVADAVEIPDDGMDDAMVMLDVTDASEDASASMGGNNVEEKDEGSEAISNKSSAKKEQSKGKDIGSTKEQLDTNATENDFELKLRTQDGEGVVIRDKLEKPGEEKAAGKEICKEVVTAKRDKQDSETVVRHETEAKPTSDVGRESKEKGNQATEKITGIQNEAKQGDMRDKEAQRNKSDRRKSTTRKETESGSVNNKTDVGKEEIYMPRARRSIRVVKKDLATQTSIEKSHSKDVIELPKEGLNSEPLFSTNDDTGNTSGVSDTIESSLSVKENVDNSKGADFSSNSDVDSAKEENEIVKEKSKTGSPILTSKIDRSMIKESLEILSSKMRSKGKKTLESKDVEATSKGKNENVNSESPSGLSPESKLPAMKEQIPGGRSSEAEALGSTVPNTESSDAKTLDTKSSDTKSSDTESSDTTSSDAKSSDVKSSGTDVTGRSTTETQESISAVSDKQLSVQILDMQVLDPSGLNKDSVKPSDSTLDTSDTQAPDVIFDISDSDPSDTNTNLRDSQASDIIANHSDTSFEIDDIANNVFGTICETIVNDVVRELASQSANFSDQNEAKNQSKASSQNEARNQNEARTLTEPSSQIETSEDLSQTSTSQESTDSSTAARRSSKRVSVRLSRKAAEEAAVTEQQTEGDLEDSNELHSNQKEDLMKTEKESLIVVQGDIKEVCDVDEEIVSNSENSMKIERLPEAIPESMVLSLSKEVKQEFKTDDRPDEIVSDRRSSPRKFAKKKNYSMDSETEEMIEKEVKVQATEVKKSHKKGASRSHKQKQIIILNSKTNSTAEEDNGNSTAELKTNLIKILLPKKENTDCTVGKSGKLKSLFEEGGDPERAATEPRQAVAAAENSSSSAINAESGLTLLEAKAISSKKRLHKRGESGTREKISHKKSKSHSHKRRPSDAVSNLTSTSKEDNEVSFTITKEFLNDILLEKEQSVNKNNASDCADSQNIGNSGLQEQEEPNKEEVADEACNTSGNIIDDDMPLGEILALKKQSHKRDGSTAKASMGSEGHDESRHREQEVKDNERQRRPEKDIDVGTDRSGAEGTVDNNVMVTEAKPKKSHKKKEKAFNLNSNSSERLEVKKDVLLKQKEERKKHRSHKKTKSANDGSIGVEIIAEKSPSVGIEATTGNEKVSLEHKKDLDGHDNKCDLLQIAKESAVEVITIEERSEENSNSILDSKKASSARKKQRASLGPHSKRKTARKSVKGNMNLKSEVVANRNETDLNIADQVPSLKDQPSLASKDFKIITQNAGAAIDLDSSVEDSLSLAAVKRVNEEPTAPCDVMGNIGDRSGIIDSKFLESSIKITEGDIKRFNETEPQTSEVSKYTEAEKEPVDMRKSARKGKRKRQIDLEDMESETIEGIFNSPDNPTEDAKKSKSGDVSFEILETDIVETVAATDKDDRFREKVADLISHITESPSKKWSPKRIVQYRQYPLRQKIESPEGTIRRDSERIDALLPEEANSKDDVKIIDVLKDDVMTSDVMKSVVMKSNVKKEKTRGVKLAFMFPHMTASSPSASKRRTGSPTVSPISGILKRRLGGKTESPSPPNKSRRVSFAYPLEEKRSIGDPLEFDKISDLAVPLPLGDDYDTNKTASGTPKRFTTIRKRLSSPKITSQNTGPAVFPDLVECNTPIEKLLPSITTVTWSRGLGNIIRSQNIRTVGNLCALSESQIEGLPIRSPKVHVVKTALRKFKTQQLKSDKQQRKGNLQTDSPSTLKTPTKDDIEALSHKHDIVETPSRKSTAKPTSLFADPEKQIAKNTQKSEDELVQVIQVTAISNEIVSPAVNIVPSSSENDTMEAEAIETGAIGNEVMEITSATVSKQEVNLEKSCLLSQQGNPEEKNIMVAERSETNAIEIDKTEKEQTAEATFAISMTTDLSKAGTVQIPSDIAYTIDTENFSVSTIAKDIVAMKPVTMDTVAMNDIATDVVANESIVINAVATQQVTMEAGHSLVKQTDPGTAESINEKLNITFESVMGQLPELSLKESVAVHRKILEFSQKVLAVIETKIDDTG